MRFAGCQGVDSASIEVLVLGQEVRRASHHLGSYNPRLDRDLSDLFPFDAGEAAMPLRSEVRRAALLPAESLVTPEQLAKAHPGCAVLVIAGTLAAAADVWGEAFEAGQIYALGGRAYTRRQRDLIRHRQRLLPLAEVDLEVATLSAVSESGDAPLWLLIDLQVLAPHHLADRLPPALGGVSIEQLCRALQAVPGERVMGFELTGYLHREGETNGLAALTAAQLLRDNILTWWCP